MRRFFLLILTPVALAGALLWWQRAGIAAWWRERLAPVEFANPALRPDPESYAVLKEDLERWRAGLAIRYRQSRTPAETAAVEHDARLLLETVLPAMMRCWLGTPWDFHGTAAIPGEGRIACGYFVSTILKDAGFHVDRYRLAQQPSENILRTFLPRGSCQLIVGRDYAAFADDLATAEPGIYLIGLDTHVAFLVVESGTFRFIHSSGSRPWCVVDESRNDAEVLRKSNWRLLGHLTAHRAVLRTWLVGESITVAGT